MSAVSNVLIVGGGIAGMTLGIALKRAGIHVTIVEKTSQWPVVGVGISLQGPALRALGAVGLLDPCVQLGFCYSHYKSCDANGNVLGTVALSKLNGPDYPATVGIMRERLQSVLMQALHVEQVPVRRGDSVTSLDQNGSGVRVTLERGTAESYDLVVGADGTHSTIREQIFETECQPAYTGQAVWRATVSRPHEVQARFSYNGPRSKVGFNPVSDQQMYIYLHQNLPAFVRVPDDRLPTLMREHLEDFGGLLAAARDEITTPDQIIYRAVTSHILPSPWYLGRVVLIGDAAHTAAPHMASGAGLAIEDAVVLAAVLASELSLHNALETFMARRYERCRMVVESAWQLGEWEKNPGASDDDHIGLLERSYGVLAQPI